MVNDLMRVGGFDDQNLQALIATGLWLMIFNKV